jgi:putative PIN family toxin of toxin-antitoxin system
MTIPRVVLDTNVVIAALRSRRGASFRVLELVGLGRFKLTVSVPLALEYEAVLNRHRVTVGLTQQDIRDLVDYLCSVSDRRVIYYLWRPYLRDPKDDFVLEAAVAGECQGIVTFNVRDFDGIDQFGLWAESPGEFLKRIGEVP